MRSRNRFASLVDVASSRLMLTKKDLPRLVVEALEQLGGSGSVVEVCRQVWESRRDELEASDDLFFTWQYDIRWAAQVLRNDGTLNPTSRGAGSRWVLARKRGALR